MIGKIEKINKKTDVKGRNYETVLINGEWLKNQEDNQQGILCVGIEYDLVVVPSEGLRPDGTPWPSTIKQILPVTDVSQPEPEEPSFYGEPQVEQKTEPCSRDESIVRQVAYKVAGEAIKCAFGENSKDTTDVIMTTLQDFAHVIAVDILRGVDWD